MNVDSIVEWLNFVIRSVSGLWHQLVGYLPLLTGPVILQLVISCITIWMTLMAGNKHPKAWLIGLANQSLWITLIVWIQAWGLVPLCLTMCYVYYRNHVKWKADQLLSQIRPQVFAYESKSDFPLVGSTASLYTDKTDGVTYIWINNGYQRL
jgi:hypothetical protein